MEIATHPDVNAQAIAAARALAEPRLPSRQPLREAVLLLFADSPGVACSRLQSLSDREWRPLLRWLDYSGMALYLLDRVTELQIREWLPPRVLARLEQKLRDNTARTRSMIAESVDIQSDLQSGKVTYAVLKGISLCPVSVPRPELRSQFDLDFLVAEKSAPAARRILERRGYRLYAISGRSWEFKRNETPGIGLKDIYSDLASYALELHIEPDERYSEQRLDRVEKRTAYGIEMPVLSPVDLFIAQGAHVFKHLCGEFSRASHLLEFRRHVAARFEDSRFWRDVRGAAGADPRTCPGLGVVTLLITQIMGEFAPEALASWTIPTLPPAVRQWVARYGCRAVTGTPPGSKLYLLLERELQRAGLAGGRQTRSALIPLRLPPAVIRAFPRERISVRLRRYAMQFGFLLRRLRFHIVEGIRYVRESYRWNRLSKGSAS